MPSFKNNVNQLRGYIRQAPTEHTRMIDDVVTLYEDKKIKNIKTALNVVEALASKNKHSLKHNRGRKLYEELLDRLKEPEAEPDNIKLVVEKGELERPKTYIKLNFNSTPVDEEGKQKYSFDQIITKLSAVIKTS